MKEVLRSKSIEAEFFGSENVWKILLRIAPPVMAAQLIQALYNIVDSFFVGRHSPAALTALSDNRAELCTDIQAALAGGAERLLVGVHHHRTYHGHCRDGDVL